MIHRDDLVLMHPELSLPARPTPEPAG